MLVNLRFKNFRSFLEESNLSMQAAATTEMQQINTFFADEKLFNKGENELLKSAVIFGGNASGKTNVIRTLLFMKRTILFSAASQSGVISNNENFVFLKDAELLDSLYEVEFIEDNNYYKYGFVINNKKIIKEWFFRRSERLTPVFERILNKITISGLNKKDSNLIAIGDKTLFLSIANNLNLDINKDVQNVIKWFENLILGIDGYKNWLEMYSLEDDKYMKQALEILTLADIGIKDIKVIKNKIANINEMVGFRGQMGQQPNFGQIIPEKEGIYNLDLQTTFDVYDEADKFVEKKKVMLFKDTNFNSDGTKKLLCYLGWIIDALDKGKTIVIDEFDSKLHFLITDYILKLFNSIDNNPNNAQLICTAHNVLLMDENLRRDQIYFTSKDDHGRSKLVSLIDYKNVRKNDLFSKKYLAGFYSKLPDMTKND